eukprot:608122-Rhodomonas_salina.2
MNQSRDERRQYFHRPLVAGQAYDHASGGGVEEGPISAADYFDPAAAAAGPGDYGDSDLGPNPDEFTQQWTKDDGKAGQGKEEFEKNQMMREYMESGLKMPRMEVEDEENEESAAPVRTARALTKKTDTIEGPD